MMNHCPHDPRQYAGMPIGMYHCPYCGEMVIAGMSHPEPLLEPIPDPTEDNDMCFGDLSLRPNESAADLYDDELGGLAVGDVTPETFPDLVDEDYEGVDRYVEADPDYVDGDPQFFSDDDIDPDTFDDGPYEESSY